MKRRNFLALAGSSLLVPEYEPVRAYSFIRLTNQSRGGISLEMPSLAPGELLVLAVDDLGNKLVWGRGGGSVSGGMLFTVPADWKGSWESAIGGQRGVSV